MPESDPRRLSPGGRKLLILPSTQPEPSSKQEGFGTPV